MTTFLKTLLLLSAAGTVCGLLLAALRKLSKGKIPPSLLYAAWIIVLLRFAVPVTGLVPVAGAAESSRISGTAYTQPLPVYPGGEVSVKPAFDVHMDAPLLSAPEHRVPAEARTAAKPVSLPTVLFIIWCCGTAGFLLWNVIPYVRFSSSLKRSLSKPTDKDVRLYDEVCLSVSPTLRRSRLISVPLTFGVGRPVIVIPDTEYEDSALKTIFSHELIHFKRHDILLKWIALIVFSAHWFNPFVRYFRKEMDKVCELSCDERLLKRMSAEDKRRYGETLLTIAENACPAPYRMMTGFSDGKKDLKERLYQIMSFQKKSKLAIALAMIPVLVLCGCAAALGPKAEQPVGAESADVSSDASIVNVSDIDGLLAAIAPDTEIRMAPGTYDLTKASDYGKSNTGKYYQWNSNGHEREYELCIEKVEGLHIVGDSAEIVTVPRASNVLVFKKCDWLTLSGLTVGHTEAVGKCEGGVIRLEHCTDAVVEHCGLYGCGTVGVLAQESRSLSVTDTDIYHCSTAGFDFSDSNGLSVENCRIYDCGSPEPYGEAAGAFLLSNTSDVSVRNCEVYDNNMVSLIAGSAENASFDGILVHDNHISYPFDFSKDLKLSNIAFSGNTVIQWTDSRQSGRIILDGSEVTENELSALWGEQMSASGIGTAEEAYLTIDRAGTREVHVTTADEFVAAIASDTTIYIDAAQIDLTECADYGNGASGEARKPKFKDRAYAWGKCADGYELFIGSIRNFHIVGGEIVTQPRYANVLNFVACSGISLENVYLGHTPEQGACMGGVLCLEQSDNIILEGCDLYGCGVLGIRASNVKDLHVQNTLIHDCSLGAAVLENTDKAVFLGCAVADCPDPHFSLRACEDFSWDNILMDPNSAFNVDPR